MVALDGICRGSHAHGVELQVVESGQLYGGGSIAARLSERNVHIQPSRCPACHLNALLYDTDIVHIHGVWDRSFHRVISTCHNLKIPYIIRPCGMLDPWSLKQKRFKKWIYRLVRLDRHLDRAAAIHFTTDEEAHLASSFCRTEQCLVEPNGVFLDDFTTDGSAKLRQQWGVPENARIAIFLGRIHPKKGIEFLVRALRLQPELDLHLIVAGSGDPAYVRQIERMAANDPRIHMVGMLQGSTKSSALATADFFALTSYQENFGNAVVEALASGTPVLISPGVNLAEVIQDRKVGEVVDLDDHAIAATLQRWTQQPHLIEDFASRCRSTAGELFDWDSIGERWIGHYQRLISQGAPQ